MWSLYDGMPHGLNNLDSQAREPVRRAAGESYGLVFQARSEPRDKDDRRVGFVAEPEPWDRRKRRREKGFEILPGNGFESRSGSHRDPLVNALSPTGTTR